LDASNAFDSISIALILASCASRLHPHASQAIFSNPETTEVESIRHLKMVKTPRNSTRRLEELRQDSLPSSAIKGPSQFELTHLYPSRNASSLEPARETCDRNQLYITSSKQN
jgi:hypothetical protein